MTYNERPPSSKEWSYDELPTPAGQELARLVNQAFDIDLQNSTTEAISIRREAGEPVGVVVELDGQLATGIYHEIWGRNAPARRGRISLMRLSPTGQYEDRVWSGSVLIDAADTTSRATYYTRAKPGSEPGSLPSWMREEQLPLPATEIERDARAILHEVLDDALTEAEKDARAAGDRAKLDAIKNWWYYPPDKAYVVGPSFELSVDRVKQLQNCVSTALIEAGAQ